MRYSPIVSAMPLPLLRTAALACEPRAVIPAKAGTQSTMSVEKEASRCRAFRPRRRLPVPRLRGHDSGLSLNPAFTVTAPKCGNDRHSVRRHWDRPRACIGPMAAAPVRRAADGGKDGRSVLARRPPVHLVPDVE